MEKARYLMIGGFLGAGKTTSINRLATYLTNQGLRVGLITNDQGVGLTDTALGRSGSFPVEEISGGCFCCRFSSLLDAARSLQEKERPDVFIAEPVGSCTDLAATVSLPLQHLYGAEFRIAPLTVVVDPIRALRLFGLEEGRQFSKNVVYIYRKQLEEAEIIVINKRDLVSDAQLTALQAALAQEFPLARQFVISAREETGLQPWLQALMTTEMNIQRVMDVDYDVYGEGEALLGWLNIAATLQGDDDWDGNALLPALASHIRASAQSDGIEIAHLKMTLNPVGNSLDLAAVNLVSTERQPELSHLLADPLETGELLLNLRAEADPDALEKAVTRAIAETCGRPEFQIRAEIAHAQHFRPGQPNPTHRFTSSEMPVD
jgi:Ni2+-binding GTPase involved in maturation of urease and hydrogenase